MKKILFILMILFSSVNALGLLEKSSNIEINPGDSGIYSILVWDRENVKIHIDIIEKPEFFYVILKQNDFYLNASSEDYVFVGNDYLPAPKVDILIRVDDNAEPGNYSLKFKLTSENEARGLSVFQERIFESKISVPGIKYITTTTETKKNDTVKLNESYTKLLIILAAVIIAAIIVLK